MTKRPEWNQRNDRDILGENAVYPGHPVTVAYVITKVFDSFDVAFEASVSGPPNALCVNAIPGAGGCVYAALSLLKRLREGMPIEQAFTWADEVWGSTDDMKNDGRSWPGRTVAPGYYLKRYQEGQAQADRFKQKLVEQRAWWEAPSQSVRA
jgi:hypothetical protein